MVLNQDKPGTWASSKAFSRSGQDALHSLERVVVVFDESLERAVVALHEALLLRALLRRHVRLQKKMTSQVTIITIMIPRHTIFPF